LIVYKRDVKVSLFSSQGDAISFKLNFFIVLNNKKRNIKLQIRLTIDPIEVRSLSNKKNFFVRFPSSFCLSNIFFRNTLTNSRKRSQVQFRNSRSIFSGRWKCQLHIVLNLIWLIYLQSWFGFLSYCPP
jgi:hypothetical protein